MKIARCYAWVLACALAVGCLSGCQWGAGAPAETRIALSDDEIQTEGVNREGVIVGGDIIYYEDRDTYESGNPYGEGEAADRHSAEEAAAHMVVNITQPGTYRLTGKLSKGQIRVDLGEDARTDPAAAVTLVLDGVDISCGVAPAILFLNVYECDHDWSAESATKDVDTSAAGANLLLAEGSTNVVNGSYVARIYKDAEGEKKLWKQDGAIYSYMSMNVDGRGELVVNAENEGVDTELHLTINGGDVSIFAQNDGINTNEDGVSVTTINGGTLHIVAGLGKEGDGIDSNGWLVINGGDVFSSAHPAADAGLDSDMGSYINGGRVWAFGSTMDWAESDSGQVTVNLQFAEGMSAKSLLKILDKDGNGILAPRAVEEDDPTADRTYRGAIISDPLLKQGETYTVYVDEVQQAYTGTDVMRGPGGFGGGRPGGQMGQPPEGGMPNFQGGERPNFPEGQMPEGGKGGRPQGEMPKWENGEMPDFGQGQMPQIPEGEMPDLTEGEMPPYASLWTPGQQSGEQMPPSTEFYMQDMVNFFSGVAAAE
ncbi:MAG: carbohydrate-binding domain-containing protein [Oscillospiraceae bacterium]|nr:carbohydrate-binding domain-containing protein [Oscillospiraceae bacterium]